MKKNYNLSDMVDVEQSGGVGTCAIDVLKSILLSLLNSYSAV